MYLSDPQNVDVALEMLGLDLDELESIVGRFTKISCRAGQLRGELIENPDGSYTIRHHFTKKKLWRSDGEV